jgi:hypothetical protein
MPVPIFQVSFALWVAYVLCSLSGAVLVAYHFRHKGSVSAFIFISAILFWVKVGGNVSLLVDSHCHLPSSVRRMVGGVCSAVCVWDVPALLGVVCFCDLILTLWVFLISFACSPPSQLSDSAACQLPLSKF